MRPLAWEPAAPPARAARATSVAAPRAVRDPLMAGKAQCSRESARVAIWPYLLFGFTAGAMLPIQFGINAQLANWVESPLRATLVSFAVAAPKLGAATLVAVILAGQAFASLLVDHFGWVGFAENPITPGRLVGIALVA